LAYLKPRSALDAQNRPVLLQALPVACDEQACMLVNFVEMAGQGAGEQPWAAASADVLKLCAVAPGPMHVLDDDMRIVGVSQSWLDWLGYGREAVTGRFVGDFMTTSSAAHFQTHTWEMLANAGAVRDLECEFVTRHGVTVTALVSARVTQGHGGMPRLVVATPVDITERKRSEESFVKLFGLSPVPMLMRKLDDPRILDVNDAFTVATGLTAENIVGHSIDELGMFEARSQRQQFETALRGPERVQNMEVRLKTAFGDMLDCLLSAQKVNAFGQTCALLVLQDVSDRRRNEMQLFEAIETVMEDTSWFSRAVIEKLAVLRSPPRSGGRSAAIGDLTPREREVLGLISHGLADVDIALKLGLTRSTVRNHVATLYSKIGVHSRSSAIIWARERGINLAWPSNGAANFIARPIAPAKASAHAMVAKTRRA
jgi:PAS domain S-box-containing protein